MWVKSFWTTYGFSSKNLLPSGLFISAVHNAGLSTLTSTPMNCGPALRTLLDRPKNEKLLFLLPVGHAAEEATVPHIERKGIDDGLMVMVD